LVSVVAAGLGLGLPLAWQAMSGLNGNRPGALGCHSPGQWRSA